MSTAATDRPARPKKQLRRAVVVRTEQLSPHLVRVVFGGDDVAALDDGGCTDSYVKFAMPSPNFPDIDLTTYDRASTTLPPADQPVLRTYTIRDLVDGQMWVDFVTHGDQGIAGPWAQRAQVGDVRYFYGPGGKYQPEPSAPWHLLVGDHSALPAVLRSFAAVPADSRVLAIVELADAADQLPVVTSDLHEFRWLTQGDQPAGAQLVAAVQNLPDFGDAPPQFFVHGEAGMVKAIRHELRVVRGLPMRGVSISGYWRSGMNEDGWQQGKAAFNADVAAAEEAALAAR